MSNIQLYNGSCNDILPTLDLSNAIIVSDPPFNIDYHYENYNKELQKDIFVKQINKNLSDSYTIQRFNETFEHLFKITDKTHKSVGIKRNGKRTFYYELDDSVIPDKIEILKEYARRPNMTKDKFNKHFHRFDSDIGFNKFVL